MGLPGDMSVNVIEKLPAPSNVDTPTTAKRSKKGGDRFTVDDPPQDLAVVVTNEPSYWSLEEMYGVVGAEFRAQRTFPVAVIKT